MDLYADNRVIIGDSLEESIGGRGGGLLIWNKANGEEGVEGR